MLRSKIVIFVNLISVFLWSVFYGWYSLPGHYYYPHFAFDKIPGHFSSPVIRGTLFIFLALSLIYLTTYLYLRKKKHISLFVLGAVGLSVFSGIMANTFLYPVGALDIYNHISELKLAFFYNLNPYAFTMKSFPNDIVISYAFFQGLLYYGPAWLIFSGIPTVFTGFRDVQMVLLGLKIFNLILLLATSFVIWQYHEDKRDGLVSVFLFLGNPLILFEGLANAHNEVLMTAFLAISLLLLKKKSVFAVSFLALSVLVKFMTGSVILFFLYRLRKFSVRKIWISLLWGAITAICILLPFWDNGQLLRGLIEGNMISQNIIFGNSLLSLSREVLKMNNAPLSYYSVNQFIFTCLFVLSSVIIFLKLKDKEFEEGMLDSYLFFLIFLSLLFQWYLLPAFFLTALKPKIDNLLLSFSLTVLGLLSYPASVWAYFSFTGDVFLIHLFLSLFILLPILVYLVFRVPVYLGRSVK